MSEKPDKESYVTLLLLAVIAVMIMLFVYNYLQNLDPNTLSRIKLDHDVSAGTAGLLNSQNSTSGVLSAPGQTVLTAASASLLGQSDVSGFMPCANQSASCAINQPSKMYYYAGSNPLSNSAVRLVQPGSFLCDASTFGVDPAPGSVKKCAYLPAAGIPGYQWCADEGGGCTLPQNSEVHYFSGDDPTRNNKTVYPQGGAFTCSVGSIGSDPSPGRPKSCYYKPSEKPALNDCGREGESCYIPVAANVYYYTGNEAHSGTVKSTSAAGQFSCSIGNFNYDPAPYQSKQCKWEPASVTQWQTCGSSCNIPGESEMSYYAGDNPQTRNVTRLVTAGSYACSPSTFRGFDPAFGTAKKCSYRLLK